MASLSLAIAMAVLASHDPAASSIVDPSEVATFCRFVEPTGTVSWRDASADWADQFRAAADLMVIIGGNTQPQAQAAQQQAQADLVAWCVEHKKSSARIAGSAQ